jgi:hypothetical protein
MAVLTRAAVGMSICFWYSNQKLRRKRESRAHTPLLRSHRDGHQALGAGDVAAQDGVGMPSTSMRLAPPKAISIVAGGVAQREVAGAETRFAPVLAIDAFTFHLQVQEEQRLSGAGHVCARVAHDLGFGIDLRQRQVARWRRGRYCR